MKINVPRVSIVLPTYNRASMLGNAIESILSQTYDSFEIIIIDDGSTDDTRSVVTKYNSPRITYEYQKNKGRSSARNKALSLAQGEYIAFLDSDDRYSPQKLERQVALLDSNPEFGMSYTSARVSDEHGEEIFRDGLTDGPHPYYRAIDSGWLYDKIAFYLPVTVLLPTVMVRSDVLKSVGGFDETLTRFEDTDMWRRISKVTPIIALDEPLTTVLTHNGNRMEAPGEVYQSLSSYVKKVFSEDVERDSQFQREGASRLFLHYGFAVNSVYCQRRLADHFYREAIILLPKFAVYSLLESRTIVVAQSMRLFAENVTYAPRALIKLLVLTIINNFLLLVKKIFRVFQ